MPETPEAQGGPVRPATALVFTTIGFVALLIFALGMTSLATGEDIIDRPGFGRAPGVAAVVLATAAFAAGLWAAIAHAGDGGDAAAGRPASYTGAVWTTAASFLAYLAGMWIGAVATGSGPAAATAVAGRLATTWFGAAVAATAFVSAWSGIALVRTRARRPRWPWEDEFDE